MKRFWVFVFLLISLLLVTPLVQARFGYEIGEQTELLQVDSSGKITLQKEFTFHVLPSSNENGTDIWVGLPTNDTRVSRAEYFQNGQWVPVKYSLESSDDQYHVSFKKFQPIQPGETGRFRFMATIPDLVYWLDRKQVDLEPEEQQVTISYIPAWWEQGVVHTLTLIMEFTSAINLDHLGFEHARPEISTTVGGKTRLTWKYTNLPPDTARLHAVYLPRTYFTANAAIQKDWISTGWLVVIFLLISGGIGIVVWAISYSVKNRRYYQTPLAYMKGDKAYTFFDPVECALFFRVSSNLLTQMIVMGLMKKNVIRLTGENTMKRVPTLESLTWYESLFLESVTDQIELIPDQWNENYKKMVDHFAEMIKGYCGQQTMNYYAKMLKKTTFGETDDPRWIVLQQQLANGVFDQQNTEGIRKTMPGHLNPYFPLFYMTLVNPRMRKENDDYYNHIFPKTNGGSTGGSGGGCACACACACASSGGCT